MFPVGVDRADVHATDASGAAKPDSAADPDSAAEFGRRQIEHWRAVLDGQPDEITVAADRPRPPALGKGGVLADLAVSPETHRRLRRTADDCGATEFMMITAALTGGAEHLVFVEPPWKKLK